MISLDPIALTGAAQEVQLESAQGGAAGWDKVKLTNESQYALKIWLAGSQHWLAAWTADVFPVAGASTLRVVPSLITSAVQPPSSTLLVSLAVPGEDIPGTFPMALTRQTSPQGLVPLGSVALVVAPGAATTFNIPAGAVSVFYDTLAAIAAAQSQTLKIVGNQSGKTYVNLTWLSPLAEQSGSVLLDPRDTTMNVTFDSPAVVTAIRVTIYVLGPWQEVVLSAALSGVGFDVSDRAARALGAVSPAAGATWDVSDRAGRLLGIIASITAAVDVSDRAARALGAVSAAAGALWDISDRVGRLVGHVSLDSGGTLKGQATMANSVPAVLASDQSALDVSDRVGRLAGHVSLDSGGTLKGQAAAANSVPVVLDSDTDRGQKTMANSLPAVIASDQSNLPLQRVVAATAFPSSSRAIGTYALVVANNNASGVVCTISNTAGTGTTTLSIGTTESLSAAVIVTQLTSGSIANPGGGVIRVYPGIAVTANVSANDVVGGFVRFVLTVSTAAATSAVTYALMP